MLADLAAHLAQWRLDIDRLFPDPGCTAVIALDWEAWWPLWGSNEPDYNGTHYYVYGQVARRLAREQNPGLSKAAIEAKAKLAWEATSPTGKQWLLATIQLARTARPNATWGYYNMPGETGEGSTDRLDYLWDAVGALFPSIYTNYPDNPSNIAYVKKVLSEARRVAARADGSVRPIYAYTMPEYEDEGWNPRPKVPESTFLSPPDFLAEFELSAQFGLAGLILYGGSADGYSKARCDVVRAYMHGTFLPQVAAVVAERNVCAAAHCSGRGTCIDHPGAAPPYCACIKGWSGADCSTHRQDLVSRPSSSVLLPLAPRVVPLTKQAAKRRGTVRGLKSDDGTTAPALLGLALLVAAPLQCGGIPRPPHPPRQLRPHHQAHHEGKIHRVDPDFGSTSTVSNRDYQSNCWVNWKIMGQPCEFQVTAALRAASARSARTTQT
jgi:hypothetical protein